MCWEGIFILRESVFNIVILLKEKITGTLLDPLSNGVPVLW